MTEERGEEGRWEREGGGGVGVVVSLMDKANEFVVEKIAQIPKPEASLEHVSFKGVGHDCITLHSHVDISNPYAHRIPFCDLTYTFKSGGKVIASGAMSDLRWIAASSTMKLELSVKVPYDFILSLIKDLGRDWQVGLTIDHLVVSSFTIPFTSEGEMKLPTLQDMFLNNFVAAVS